MPAISNRAARNICLVMAVAESALTIRYAVDTALGGGTQWWQTLSAAIIAAALYRLWWHYRARAHNQKTR